MQPVLAEEGYINILKERHVLLEEHVCQSVVAETCYRNISLPKYKNLTAADVIILLGTVDEPSIVNKLISLTERYAPG
jgi:hypothetical protein